MMVESILVDGFKNLSQIKIAFDQITALVALNNFGKSNVLQGIEFGLGFMRAQIEDRQVIMANSNLVPMNRHMQGRNFRFEVEVSTVLDGHSYRIQYGYEFAWKRSEEESPEIVREFLRAKLDEKGQKFARLIDRTRERALYKSSETARCASPIKVDPLELAINKLGAYDGLYYADIVKKLSRIKIYMENNLDAKSFYLPDPVIHKGLENEMVNALNLPRIIFNLKNHHPDKFELLKNVFHELFPNIRDLIVKDFKISNVEGDPIPDDAPFAWSSAIYMLYVKDANLSNPVDFSLMSDGAKRVFMILTKIIVSSLSNISIIAIEEPENSVHPWLFRDYIQIISQLLDDCRVIITSHSPYIISYLDPSWIYVGRNRVSGVAEFYSFKKSGQRQLQKDAARFKMEMGDYLFSMLADSESTINEYLECEENE